MNKWMLANEGLVVSELSRGDDVVPIPDTKRRRYLEQDVAAASSSLPPRVSTRSSPFPRKAPAQASATPTCQAWGSDVAHGSW